jgi:predicted amidohydrolase
VLPCRLTLAALFAILVAVGCSASNDPPPSVGINAVSSSMRVPPASDTADAVGNVSSTAEPSSAQNSSARTNEDLKTPAEKPNTVRVAAIQCSSVLGDVQGNRAKITKLVKEAAGNGAKIVVLPETAITGYLSQDLRTNWHLAGRPIERNFRSKNPAAFAEAVPGESTKHFCELAKQLQIYLTIPLLEIDESPIADSNDKSNEPAAARFYNTVCLASPQGELVAHYRKLTPWPHPEKSWATAGDRGVQVYDTEYGRVGLAICYDIHTILEKYEPHKIWTLLYPIAWVDESHPADWFWHRLPERIAPFKHYVIGANWSVDGPQKWYGYGFSTIFGPDGKVIATAKSLYGDEILYATIATQTP